MPQKSPVASEPASEKAIPVKAVHFSQMVRWPGFAGAGSSLVSRALNPSITNPSYIWCDTIFQYRGKFCIDGKWFMPESAGAILTWEY